MTWRYGLIKTYYPHLDEYEYAVHEIYDNVTGEGDSGWTAEPVSFHGETRDVIEKALSDALLDISRESDEEIEARSG